MEVITSLLLLLVSISLPLNMHDSGVMVTNTTSLENVTLIPASQYPVFNEFRNFIYFNLEAILLVASPLAIIVLFVAKKVNDRVKLVEAETSKVLLDEKNAIHKRLDDIEENLKEFKKSYETRLGKAEDKHDKLYESFKNLETSILSEIKLIRYALDQQNVNTSSNSTIKDKKY